MTAPSRAIPGPDFPSFSLLGRVALITGAARGIGLAIANPFASAGDAVAIQDIDLDAARESAGKITETGGHAVALAGDATHLPDAAGIVDQTLDLLGGLHILANNAAVQQSQHWLLDSPDQIEQQLRANLTFPILLSQRAVPVLTAQNWGRIINIGSMQGRSGNPAMLAYAASECFWRSTRFSGWKSSRA